MTTQGIKDRITELEYGDTEVVHGQIDSLYRDFLESFVMENQRGERKDSLHSVEQAELILKADDKIDEKWYA